MTKIEPFHYTVDELLDALYMYQLDAYESDYEKLLGVVSAWRECLDK